MEKMKKTELAESIPKELLTLSSEGKPVFGKKIPQMVEPALNQNKPILFATIMCRISKLTGHANRRFWTPDIIWAKERNDHPVEITAEAAQKNGIDLINPKLGMIFAEIPQTIKRISTLGLPWQFLLVIADDPSLEVRKSLARQFKTFDQAAKAFKVMCHLHRLAIQKVLTLGLENQGINQEALQDSEKISSFSFQEIKQINFPNLGTESFIDMCGLVARELKEGNLQNLPRGILDEFDEATTFWREREPSKTEEERKRAILEELIPSKVLLGKFLGECNREKKVGTIILSAIRPQPLDETQSLLAPSQIPVLFPFKNVEGNSFLSKVEPTGILVPPQTSWFSLASVLTLELTKWLSQELEGMDPTERKMAQIFMPIIFGRKKIHE